MKKMRNVIIMSLLASIFLIGCNSGKLADSIDKTEVENNAKAVVESLNKGEYQDITNKVREDIQDKLTPEILEDAVEKTYPKAGEFKEYKKITVLGKTTEGKDIAVAIVIATYENQEVQFTISFDTNGKIIGFFMK